MRIRKIHEMLLVVGAMLTLPCAGMAAGDGYSLKNGFGMSVSVEPKTGDYSVSLNGQDWFGPGRVSALSESAGIGARLFTPSMTALRPRRRNSLSAG